MADSSGQLALFRRQIYISANGIAFLGEIPRRPICRASNYEDNEEACSRARTQMIASIGVRSEKTGSRARMVFVTISTRTRRAEILGPSEAYYSLWGTTGCGGERRASNGAVKHILLAARLNSAQHLPVGNPCERTSHLEPRPSAVNSAMRDRDLDL